MNSIFKIGIATSVALLLVGCGHSPKVVSLNDSSKVITLDGSKQVALGFEKVSINKTNNNIIEKKVFYCLGKSPDIIENQAKQAKLIADILGKGSLNVSGSSAKGTASVAFKTQTLELLRDQSLMNCISYGAGGLSKYGLEALNRKGYNILPVLSAIDGLTGSISNAPVSLTSSSSVGSAEQLAKVSNLIVTETNDVNKLKDSVNTLTKEVDNLKEDLDKKHKPEDIKKLEEKEGGTKEQKYIEYLNDKKPYDEKSKELARTKETLSLKEETLKTLKDSKKSIDTTGTSSTSSSFGTVINTRVGDETIKQVSSDIVKIIDSYYNIGNLSDMCAIIVGDNFNIKPQEGSMLSLCMQMYAEGTLKMVKNNNTKPNP